VFARPQIHVGVLVRQGIDGAVRLFFFFKTPPLLTLPFFLGLLICKYRFLPQIYPALIINDLYLYGTKMFPQFE